MKAIIYAGLDRSKIKNFKIQNTPLSNAWLNQVSEFVCNKYGVTIEDLKSRSRDRYRCNYPRRTFFYLAYNYSLNGYKKVGQFLNKDHATVIHHCKQYQQALDFKYDPMHDRFAEILNEFKLKFNKL